MHTCIFFIRYSATQQWLEQLIHDGRSQHWSRASPRNRNNQLVRGNNGGLEGYSGSQSYGITAMSSPRKSVRRIRRAVSKIPSSAKITCGSRQLPWWLPCPVPCPCAQGICLKPLRQCIKLDVKRLIAGGSAKNPCKISLRAGKPPERPSFHSTGNAPIRPKARPPPCRPAACARRTSRPG
jgi:hypothetical protein